MPGQEYSFELRKIGVKERELVYLESGRGLVIYLEASGVPEYDWVGTYASFEPFAAPDGGPLDPAKQQQLLDRIAQWGRENNIRIGIGPALPLEEVMRRMEQAGSKRTGPATFQSPFSPGGAAGAQRRRPWWRFW